MSGAAVVSWLSLTSKSLQLFKYGLDFHSRAVSAMRSSLAMLSLGSHTHELLLLLAVLSASHLCLRILGVFLDNMRNCEELWHSKAPQSNKPLKASRACRWLSLFRLLRVHMGRCCFSKQPHGTTNKTCQLWKCEIFAWVIITTSDLLQGYDQSGTIHEA